MLTVLNLSSSLLFATCLESELHMMLKTTFVVASFDITKVTRGNEKVSKEGEGSPLVPPAE